MKFLSAFSTAFKLACKRRSRRPGARRYIAGGIRDPKASFASSHSDRCKNIKVIMKKPIEAVQSKLYMKICSKNRRNECHKLRQLKMWSRLLESCECYVIASEASFLVCSMARIFLYNYICIYFRPYVVP